jgi:vacuolar-type H+-ATPase subunit H
MDAATTDPLAEQPTASEMRAEAAAQLKSARELAKKVRGEAVRELEDARSRVRRIAVREEEMAERWAKLLEAENQATVAATVAATVVSADPDELIRQAQAEAGAIIDKAQKEARGIREEAMRLLAVAEGEKAESREIAQSETERAMNEAERMRAEAEQEAERLRLAAERVSAGGGDSIYSKRGGRKLPRIGDSASSLLSEMSDLRAKSAEDKEDRQVS